MLVFGGEPRNPTFAPDWREQDSAAVQLWDATRDLSLYRDNTNAEENATAEAYERRNKAIFEATGTQLQNPYAYTHEEFNAWRTRSEIGFSPLEFQRRNSPTGPQIYAEYVRRKWINDVQRLAREHPEAAARIRADVPIEEDAFAIAREAEAGFDRAALRAQDAGVSETRRTLNVLGGGLVGSLRDPMQIGTLFLGGGPSSAGRLVFGRVLERVFVEAAVNAGAEAALQVASQDWRRRAGVEHGFGPALQEVGIAALFGGAFGGVLQGGTEVFRALGRVPPAGALERIAAGNPEPGDFSAIAGALDVSIDADLQRAMDLAIEQGALDADAFGPSPAAVDPVQAEAAAVAAVRAIEADLEPPPGIAGLRDASEVHARIERIVRAELGPVGKAPRKPSSLIQFLAGRGVGGIRDEGGELAAMDLTNHFVPGRGRLVRQKGKSLDYAREAAAEAGYFDHLYGNPDRAVAESTVDDLLRLIRDEAGGQPTFRGADQGMLADRELYEQGLRQREEYRRVVADVDHAAAELGLERLDDRLLVRAAELVDDETDTIAALERALDEDYRNYAGDAGAEPFDDDDIPFFEDARAGADAGGQAGEAGADGGSSASGGPAQAGGGLSRAGGDEGAQALEPGTPPAAEAAAAVLEEARKPSPQSSAARERLAGLTRKPTATIDGKAVTFPDAYHLRFFELGDALMRENGISPRDAANDALDPEIDLELGEWADEAGELFTVMGRFIADGTETLEDFARASVEVAAHMRASRSAGRVIDPDFADEWNDLVAEAQRGALQEVADLWDTLPAGRDVEGNLQHTTHAELVEDADRSEFYADFIQSCRSE